MAKKEKRGGKREGAGRPAVKDKAAPITVYVRESIIRKVGREKLKQSFIKTAEREYKKLK